MCLSTALALGQQPQGLQRYIYIKIIVFAYPNLHGIFYKGLKIVEVPAQSAMKLHRHCLIGQIFNYDL